MHCRIGYWNSSCTSFIDLNKLLYKIQYNIIIWDNTIKVHLCIFAFLQMNHYIALMQTALIDELLHAFPCLSASVHTWTCTPFFVRVHWVMLKTSSSWEHLSGILYVFCLVDCLRQLWNVSLRTSTSVVGRSSTARKIINHPFICFHTLPVSMRLEVTRTRTQCVWISFWTIFTYVFLFSFLVLEERGWGRGGNWIADVSIGITSAAEGRGNRQG